MEVWVFLLKEMLSKYFEMPNDEKCSTEMKLYHFEVFSFKYAILRRSSLSFQTSLFEK